MLKETIIAMTVVTAAAGAALPIAAQASEEIVIAACNACNPCNPCAAKKAACNPCNPCAAKNPCNPCNPCAAKKK